MSSVGVSGLIGLDKGINFFFALLFGINYFDPQFANDQRVFTLFAMELGSSKFK